MTIKWSFSYIVPLQHNSLKTWSIPNNPKYRIIKGLTVPIYKVHTSKIMQNSRFLQGLLYNTPTIFKDNRFRKSSAFHFIL